MCLVQYFFTTVLWPVPFLNRIIYIRIYHGDFISLINVMSLVFLKFIYSHKSHLRSVFRVNYNLWLNFRSWVMKKIYNLCYSLSKKLSLAFFLCVETIETIIYCKSGGWKSTTVFLRCFKILRAIILSSVQR